MLLTTALATSAPAFAQANQPSPWFAAGKPRLATEPLTNPDYVQKPWTELEHHDGTVDAWGRSYVFTSPTGLMNTTSGGALLLNRSIALEISTTRIVNKTPVTTTKTARFSAPTAQSVNKGRVVLSRNIEDIAQVSGRIDFTVNYDGLVEATMAIQPRAGEDKLSGVKLLVSFSAEQSQLMHYIGAPKKFDSQSRSYNSYSWGLFDKTDWTLKLPFKTAVWIGNNNRGLQIGAESDQGWWPVNRTDCIEFRKNADGSGLLTLALLTQTAPDPATPLIYKLAFMATPIKPMPEGWRGWTYTAQEPDDRKDRGNHVIYWGGGWRYYTLDPEPHRASQTQIDRTKFLTKMDLEFVPARKIIPYWSRTYVIEKEIIDGVTQTNADTARFLDTDGPSPNNPTVTVAEGTPQRRRVNSHTWPIDGGISGWSDYLVWSFNEWGKVFDHTDGLYLDDTPPTPNYTARTGGGYKDFGNNDQPTFDFHGTRDILLRTNYLLQENGVALPSSIVHNSATYWTFAMSPAAAFLTGEQFNIHYLVDSGFCDGCGSVLLPDAIPKDNPAEAVYYYSHALPMERLRAEGYYKQWGIPIVWLGQLKFDDKYPQLKALNLDENVATARDFLSRVLQVDSLFWPITGLIKKDEVDKAMKFRRDFGVADSAVTFTPYWENTAIVPQWSQTQPGKVTDAIKIGFYTHPGNGSNKYLAIVSNISRQPANIKVRFTDLPNAASRKITIAGTSKTLANSNGVVDLLNQCLLPNQSASLCRNDYIALIIE